MDGECSLHLKLEFDSPQSKQRYLDLLEEQRQLAREGEVGESKRIDGDAEQVEDHNHFSPESTNRLDGSAAAPLLMRLIDAGLHAKLQRLVPLLESLVEGAAADREEDNECPSAIPTTTEEPSSELVSAALERMKKAISDYTTFLEARDKSHLTTMASDDSWAQWDAINRPTARQFDHWPPALLVMWEDHRWLVPLKSNETTGEGPRWWGWWRWWWNIPKLSTGVCPDDDKMPERERWLESLSRDPTTVWMVTRWHHDLFTHDHDADQRLPAFRKQHPIWKDAPTDAHLELARQYLESEMFSSPANDQSRNFLGLDGDTIRSMVREAWDCGALHVSLLPIDAWSALRIT